jgi:hypothetical protein
MHPKSKLSRVSRVVLVLAMLFAGETYSQTAADAGQGDATDALQESMRMIKPEVLWFLSYDWGEESGAPYNHARIERGYLTLKFKPCNWFEPRVTLDVHQDDTGDFKTRFKYLYGKFILPVETIFFTEPYIEFGIVHTPWFDFEEHLNWYRAQGTMFIERNGILNSADVGLTVGGLFGVKMDKDYRDKVNPKYPGVYGSFALGVYNGSGYHAAEANQNKVFEARLTLRPLWMVLPGMQLTYFYINGLGNTPAEPGWRLHDMMLSYEHEFFTATVQYAIGDGNQAGNRVDSEGAAQEFSGFSFFGEIKLPWIKSTLIARYDNFDWDTDGGPPMGKRLIAGYAFHFLKHNFLMLSYDRSWTDDQAPADWKVGLTLQVAYPAD